MTVGGRTIGSATRVSIAGASRQRVVLSQCARGSPHTPRISVVIAASRSVSQSDCQSGAGRPRKLEVTSDKKDGADGNAMSGGDANEGDFGQPNYFDHG